MKTGYVLGDSLANFANEEYDYLFFSPPCLEDAENISPQFKGGVGYSLFLTSIVEKAHPKNGTFTVAFTGARRKDSRIISKSFYLEWVAQGLGYYLRDRKIVKKSNSYNAYSAQFLDVLTFQKHKTKGIYNLRKNKSYSTYGMDVWGPFNKEALVDGEVVGQPIEIASFCIENFTNPGQVVFDPFAGLGTTCEAARRLGREFLGYELREKIWQYGVDKYPLIKNGLGDFIG